MKETIQLIQTKRTDPKLLERMKTHYSQPKGFVGRNIPYAVFYKGEYYGHIIGGSATLHLPGRYEYLRLDSSRLNNIVNNIFFNVTPIEGKYPIRNFTTQVVKTFTNQIKQDWLIKYGDEVLGYETLVEKPRTGELYLRAGWEVVGETIGFTCKRVAGNAGEKWGGQRVWTKDKNNLKPKLVLCYRPN